MFKVVELTTGAVLASFAIKSDADHYIEQIESAPEYSRLLSTYGYLRRVQQELTVACD